MTLLGLGPGGEFDRIRAIAAALGSRGTALGDDCALIPEAGGWIALSCDLTVEDVHYRSRWIQPREVGWRAAMAALSDLAGEGAEAIGILVSLGVPAGAEDEIVSVMEGAGEAAEVVGGTILGGDLSTAPVWTLDVTAVGRATNPVTRAGARPGDRVWVTGVLGGARSAVAAWNDGREPSPESRRAFAEPRARIKAGLALAALGAHAMMDLSDGLAGDAGHLAAASGVKLVMDLESIPLHRRVNDEAGRSGTSPGRFAALGGEDYELLVTMPDGFGSSEAVEFSRNNGVALTRVGSVEEGTGALFLERGVEVSVRGFNHFR